jgi:hypothetical protein|uniref:Cas system-associated protein n=1 Tax=Siphoviridae sp. ctmYS12 TaxID=2825652 RepID=A0A8S5P5X4_9CAUD|nr:MAG TPA: Cas system-associated protein [Siphoviridae sp. ctmYS12]
MNFVKHSNLEGLHAPFSASQSAWLRYDTEKALTVYDNMRAKERGTKLHDWAKRTIDLGIKQPRSNKTLYAYVNDAIGFKMSTEVVLYYSPYFFGTADAISFRNNKLRIHDLKTGKSGHMEQLEVYAALFCLEYKIKPGNIQMELRLYKDNEVIVHEPTAEDILPIMDKIMSLNKALENFDDREV